MLGKQTSWQLWAQLGCTRQILKLEKRRPGKAAGRSPGSIFGNNHYSTDMSTQSRSMVLWDPVGPDLICCAFIDTQFWGSRSTALECVEHMLAWPTFLMLSVPTFFLSQGLWLEKLSPSLLNRYNPHWPGRLVRSGGSVLYMMKTLVPTADVTPQSLMAQGRDGPGRWSVSGLVR